MKKDTYRTSRKPVHVTGVPEGVKNDKGEEK